jgi:hypothetical protein
MTTLSIQEKPLGLSSARIVLMAAACGFAVSTLYYNQPLLPQMGASFGRSSADAGLIASQRSYSLVWARASCCKTKRNLRTRQLQIPRRASSGPL